MQPIEPFPLLLMPGRIMMVQGHPPWLASASHALTWATRYGNNLFRGPQAQHLDLNLLAPGLLALVLLPMHLALLSMPLPLVPIIARGMEVRIEVRIAYSKKGGRAGLGSTSRSKQLHWLKLELLQDQLETGRDATYALAGDD